MKKIISLILVVSLCIASLSITASANEIEHDEITCSSSGNDENVQPPDDIMALEPYIYVDENGHFQLQEAEALANGIDLQLIKTQVQAFESLNVMADNHTITIHEDLSIDNNRPVMRAFSYGHSYHCTGGITTDPVIHWWGVSRYLCDCQTRYMSTGYAGLGLITALFPGVGGFGAAYCGFTAAAMANANYGRGIHMSLTWALLFSVSPQ